MSKSIIIVINHARLVRTSGRSRDFPCSVTEPLEAEVESGISYVFPQVLCTWLLAGFIVFGMISVCLSYYFFSPHEILLLFTERVK